jgi:hypothetical protein
MSILSSFCSCIQVVRIENPCMVKWLTYFFFVKCVSVCIHIMEIIVAINDGSDCVFEILAAFDININY